MATLQRVTFAMGDYSFHERPLAWLFWAAALCLNAAAIASDHEPAWDMLVVGQLIVLGAWLALGESHRLARAGVGIAAIALLAAPDYFMDRYAIGWIFYVRAWPLVLGNLILVTATMFLFTWCFHALAVTMFMRGSAAKPGRWQFPLAEIFGWMLVVAVAVVGVQQADYGAFWPERRAALYRTLMILPPIAAVMALSLGHIRANLWPGAVVAGAWAVLLAAWIVVLVTGVDVQKVLGACLFAGAWIFVLKLDALRRHRLHDRSPVLRLHDETAAAD